MIDNPHLERSFRVTHSFVADLAVLSVTLDSGCVHGGVVGRM